MARYATTEKVHMCPLPRCGVRFTEREAVTHEAADREYIMCPRCVANDQRPGRIMVVDVASGIAMRIKVEDVTDGSWSYRGAGD